MGGGPEFIPSTNLTGKQGTQVRARKKNARVRRKLNVMRKRTGISSQKQREIFLQKQADLERVDLLATIESIPASLFKDVSIADTQFLIEYFKDMNGTRAAREVGKGNEPSHGQLAYMTLKKPEVRAAKEKIENFIKEKMAYNLDKSIRLQFQIFNEARAADQYVAVNSIKQHLDALAGIYDPNKFRLEHTMKAPFVLDLSGIKTPEYVTKEKDVTPKTPEIVEIVGNKESGEPGEV